MPSTPLKGDDLVQITLLGEALDNLPLAVVVAQENGVFVAVNNEACRLTGYSREELLALRAGDLSGRPPREHQRKMRDFKERQRAPGNGPLRRKDGTIVEVDYRWMPTRVAGMDFFLFLLVPADDSFFAPMKGKRVR